MDYGVWLICFVKVCYLFFLNVLWYIIWFFKFFLYNFFNVMSFLFILVKDCGNLLMFFNGFVIGYEIIYLNELEFKCDDGFEFWGFVSRRCEVDGKWSGVEVNC